MIRVLLVHDTCLMRSVLAERLDREPDLEVVHTAWPGAAARARTARPDVCVADLDCSDSYGMAPLADLCEQAARAGTARPPRLVVLASTQRPGLLRRAAEAQAAGYVDKASTAAQLIRAIREVVAGKRFVDESLGFGFLRAAEMPLTQRELSVLALAARGASIAEIAGSLHLSRGTVRNYMAAITRKTGARNRVDAIRISQGEGWV
ncbi:response regulator transcription factor [Streptomyces indicus]|uniref:Two-component system, NarL family, response regulator DesR n=1 Tax=Streptomyces indicus TaxID=417292 RepID=A0A1G8YGL4_9ACTN|nr:response regulator transcription factor [Streptomyces indicus]SDK01797.1 two-component system, NarL family, response regulator DesR [Streptomyces indicus]